MMNPKGSLFQRLAGDVPQQQSFDKEEQLMMLISAHLTKMLGTRVGSVKMLPDYGLPDLNNMGLSLDDTLRHSRMIIEKMIRTYEPRLFDVHVTVEEYGGCLLRRTFSIGAALDIAGVKKSIRFSAMLGGDGKISIV
ncbi:type VI secretion system baseplate subunit TssE [Pseudomonas syringae]|uniref:Type VI secretion system baseplate subunit TssE n=1 Tax=Pseudomonas syringae pv. syringae TaxID=321 RepID=A0AB35JN23_PSESY|nr:type VI secretion system baseplate subunit TssE [Pseudomonas syringae]MBI6752249.1 type VI secretion system baseplate subunit TssE [Pseudomonas syringae]MBI6771576.1 type VI secretion system baseplate subunit TssE [Pseudomonas syringae]MBI6778373.1 type VI secretion system baseplate subunit TssE [Pseudomonas syringae]MBI6791596.1 type VI secretion system baseplate subunit TssE [Pseudomonas syringae]MBI6803325.1 type VI secretion system baseplate subunit TssE [Pseudomonas syringae]